MKKNIIDLLKADHRKVEKLFSKIEKAKTAPRKESLFQTLKEEFLAHAEGEEAVLYPRIQEIKKLREVAFEAYEEHSIAKYLVSELENGDPGTEQWNAKCKTLKDIIDHHVEEEEDELFPQMKKLIARSELLKLGDFFDQYKKTGVRPIDESSWRKPTGLDLIPQPHL